MVLDSALCSELGGYVETLTHSGEKTLDAGIVKKLKSICKLSDAYVEHVYHLLLYQLQKSHAEIRYSALQVCNELFRRSHCFRELLIADMQLVMELAAETSPDRPLPPPRARAHELKRLALQTIKEWNTDYGEAYKKLQLGFNFLRHCKKVDFNALEIQNLAERAKQEERERRQNKINQEKIKQVASEMEECVTEVSGSITTLQNCMALLLPSLDNFFVEEQEDMDENPGEPLMQDDSDSEAKVDLRAHGIGAKYNIEVNLDPEKKIIIRRTEENSAILDNARDHCKLISNRYLPQVKRWVQVITKAAGDSQLLKQAIDLRHSLETALKKYEKLNLDKVTEPCECSDDSDFEEVETKNDYEDTVTSDLGELAPWPAETKGATRAVKQEEWGVWQGEGCEEDPSTAHATLSSLNLTAVPKSSRAKEVEREPGPSSSKDYVEGNSTDAASAVSSPGGSRKTKLLAVAPKLPFDIDLYHWEDKELTAPTLLAVKTEGSHFWAATNSEDLEQVTVPDGAATLRTRVIEFSGQFQPVKWACRAPLPSGKLCPRRDRYKCPFHGLVVARDEMGRCVRPEDEERLARLQEEEQQRNPDWQDPQLLEELKQATGVDLKMPPKKGEKKLKKKQGSNKLPKGLTDISGMENTVLNRLSKKIFKKSTVKRVASSLDSLDRKRFRDKYGDQFNYVHDTA